MSCNNVFKYSASLSLFVLLFSCSANEDEDTGRTEILKWRDGKSAAVSITYDDGSINQFRVAVPLMEERGFRGTFFINTGLIPGSQFHARFIGRPVEEIIQESATVPTNEDNLFERGSAVGFLGYPSLVDVHSRAGSAVDAGRIERAIRIIDEAYARVRAGEVDKNEPASTDIAGADLISWDELREFASRGHEFANHTISHARLAILDEPNMLWELEKCKEELLNQLGQEQTFSGECPYGTENERVMEYALKIQPALRNRMPEDFLAELNRSSRRYPGEFDKPYVQWQRGPLSETPLDLMRSWIDTCTVHDNTWLVLVIHGVEGIGWEAIPKDTLTVFFDYMKSHDPDLWVAPFRDVTKYMRERMHAKVETTSSRNQIRVELTQDLDLDQDSEQDSDQDTELDPELDSDQDTELYDLPLSVRTYIPDRWETVKVLQYGEALEFEIGNNQDGRFVTYQARPGEEPILVKAARN